jgi:citrate lyase gamma subunit
VDVEQNIAWKNGLFQFSNSDMRTVMNQISRWYDVTIEYKSSVPEKHFGGYISRESKLSQVLKMLELSGVKFKIEEKKIIVLP